MINHRLIFIEGLPRGASSQLIKDWFEILLEDEDSGITMPESSLQVSCRPHLSPSPHPLLLSTVYPLSPTQAPVSTQDFAITPTSPFQMSPLTLTSKCALLSNNSPAYHHLTLQTATDDNPRVGLWIPHDDELLASLKNLTFELYKDLEWGIKNLTNSDVFDLMAHTLTAPQM